MEPSWTRDGTHVPCVGGQILNHWAIREVPMLLSDGCRVLPYLGVKPDSAASTHSLVFVFLILFLIGRYLLYNIVIVSAICQHESVMGIDMSSPSNHPTPLL